MATAETATDPLHPTVLDALRNTPVGPMLGQPVEQVLAGLGLPAFPQLPALAPLPGLPVLPPLDVAALAKPITDLFSGFGDGNIGGTGAVNPQTLLTNVIQAVQTAMQWASQGIQLLQSLEGAGPRSAATSAATAQLTSGVLTQQAGQMHMSMGAAAGTVAVGYAQMGAVAARFALTTAALGLTLATPAGQVALLASALEAATEALAITATTKAHLIAHSGHMSATGQKVPTHHLRRASLNSVTSSAKGVQAKPAPRVGTQVKTAKPGTAAATTAPNKSIESQLTQLISQLQQVVQPLLSTARQLGHEPSPVPSGSVPRTPTGSAAGTESRGAALQDVGIVGGATSLASAPLGQWQSQTAFATPVPAVTTASVVPGAAVTMTEEAMPPILPATGALLGANRAGAANGTDSALVTARHGDELVGGEPADTTTPVIGDHMTSGPDTPLNP
ncbi:hypothetical protein [Nocardia sp. NPDC050175]|uniref:hypothetical protein n=1 Tax=Nocardia sp. NPDC050175 TaxID=3364317 RepID=UPI0037A9FB74